MYIELNRFITRFITRLIDLGGLSLIVVMRKKVGELSLSYNRPVLFIRNSKSNSFSMDQINPNLYSNLAK